jgi:hypothetical protein
VLQNLPGRGKSVADNTSSYSDLLLWKIHPEFLKNARKTRLSIVTIAFVGLTSVQQEHLLNQISKIAHKYNFMGEWSRVRDLLTIPQFTPYSILVEHLRDRSEDDFYGNDLRTMKRIYDTLKTYNPYIPRTPLVKNPQRKRGYDDKGHLRKSSSPRRIAVPDHKPERIPYIKSSEKFFFEDFDSFRRNNKTQETLVVNRTSRKEAYYEKLTDSTSNRTDPRQKRKTKDTTRVSRKTSTTGPKTSWEIKQEISKRIDKLKVSEQLYGNLTISKKMYEILENHILEEKPGLDPGLWLILKWELDEKPPEVPWSSLSLGTTSFEKNLK